MLFRFVLFCSLILACTFAVALDLKPHWPPSQKEVSKNITDDMVVTKESIVNANGTKYRRIETRNRVFFVKMQEAEHSASDDDVICGTPAGLTQIPEKMVEASVKISKRTHLFIDGLSKRCDPETRHAVITPDYNMGIGVSSKNKDGSDKKIFYNPFANGLGFSTGW